MLVRFSEKVFDACPHILDEPLHVAIPAHASHVDHVGAKVAGGRSLRVSETPSIYHVRQLAGCEFSENLPAFGDARFLPPVGLGAIEASPISWYVPDAISEIFASQGHGPEF